LNVFLGPQSTGVSSDAMNWIPGITLPTRFLSLVKNRSVLAAAAHARWIASAEETPIVARIHTQFHSLYGSALFLPNMSLQPVTGSIVPCETDIFIAMQEGNKVVLAVGECKDAGGSFTADDVGKMTGVADALSNSGLHCYVIFAKTGSFTAADVENCKLANRNGRTRAIMLSDRELEPYRAYERTSLELEISRGGYSLHDMAITTHEAFFSPRPRKGARTANV
jgi:hypothetical protein